MEPNLYAFAGYSIICMAWAMYKWRKRGIAYLHTGNKPLTPYAVWVCCAALHAAIIIGYLVVAVSGISDFLFRK